MANDEGQVRKRGERKGQAVEKQPPGEAERDAAVAEDRVPLDARTGEPSDVGRMERPDPGSSRGDNLSDMAEREPHDRGS